VMRGRTSEAVLWINFFIRCLSVHVLL
jgi:hypothetical protein